ncbi:hypothetical protein CCY99_01995 [Helicobacter sp. 16-1353]|uniref:SDR family NAD(P)-dependent oxidoreductase n=1 Tax=Helicobacter sp. 16-1353 TaxID=2004996 RepID=UPI000DCF46CC|nr:SDR family NAD(P)-dependent oxidoreductase [Helicobacter sp. 16-1353]RAX54939.1 hypothetical protein CCY99_01995 [Helicobacter sp. 16-1353]
MFKNIIITGASDGIGYELCLLFSQYGARIYANGRSVEKLEKLKAKCLEIGAKEVSIFACDVSNRDSIIKWLDSIFNSNKNIDLVLANAGIARANNALESDFNVLEVNILGVANTILPSINYLKMQSISSQIAITGSAAGYFVMPSSYSYSSSKVFCNALAEGLYLNLKDSNIAVSIINPGFVDTNLIKNAKYKIFSSISPQKAAKIILSGLIRKKRVISFPFFIVFLARFYNILPISIKRMFQFILPKGL